MAKTFLKHRGRCGGGIVLDISRGFIISSPSIAISPAGLSIGVTEISTRKGAGTAVDFLCSKCSQQVNPQEMSCKCLVCQEFHQVKDVFVSPQILFVCDSCKRAIEGNSENMSQEMKQTISYLKAPRESLQFVPLLEVLQKPIK